MKIRRYIGKDTQEAILKVKMDLGNDAMILNTRKVRKKGLMNIFSKPVVEILAAVDEYEKKANKNIEKKQMIENKLINKNETVRLADENVEKISEMEQKINKIENMMENIYNNFSNNNKLEDEMPKKQDNSIKKSITAEFSHLLYKKLVLNEVEPEIADELISRLKKVDMQNSNYNEYVLRLSSILNEKLGKPEIIQLKEEATPTVVIFVGPTGVGKTTTLAKLAANYSLNYRKKVSLITTDTYRIAAVDQLKTYAEILGIPLSVVYTTDELKNAIVSFEGSDLVFIDTAGRSHNNTTHFEEIKNWVEASSADEVYLLISMTTSMKACRDIIRKYDFLENYKLIFTKIDEAPFNGLILNIKMLTGRNISYITTGQNVPDDIEVADTELICKNLIKEQ